MRFMVDECTGPAVARHLEEAGHIVFSVYTEARGAKDRELLRTANENDYILVTNDKDFGELTFRQKMKHKGIILLRLEDESSTNKIKVLDRFLGEYSDKVEKNFCVVTEGTVRIIRA